MISFKVGGSNLQKIAIITDSGCDLSQETIKENNIHVLPFRIIYSDREFLDKVTISEEKVYEDLANGIIPTTSLPDLQYTENIIEKLKNEGYTHAVVVTVSSNLSGTFNSIQLLCEEHPELTYHFFDTKTLGFPVGAMALEVAKLIKEKASFKEIVDKLPSIKENVSAYVTFNTLEFLKRGGRIGKVAGTVGEILHLKPIISSDDEGQLYPFCKVRGRKKSISKLKEILNSYLDEGKCRVWVLNGAALEEARAFFEEIKNYYNISKISFETIGAAMGVHTGPGAIGLCIKKEY